MNNKRKSIIFLLVVALNSCGSRESESVNSEIKTENIKNKSSLEIMNDTTPTNNIDALVTNASKSGNPEDLTKLWKAFLSLKQWHFITKYKDNIQDNKPFIGVIDNLPWVFIFSDRQKAQQYCLNEKNTGFTDSKGGVYIISLETDKAISYILDLHSKGVYGMRINEGNGWFSPIVNLNAIIEHVNKTK